MTQQEFDQLPLLLRPGDVRRALGLDYHEVRELPRKQEGIATKLPGGKQYRFFKSEIAKLAGLEYK